MEKWKRIHTKREYIRKENYIKKGKDISKKRIIYSKKKQKQRRDYMKNEINIYRDGT